MCTYTFAYTLQGYIKMAQTKLQFIEDLKKWASIAKEVGDRAGEGIAYSKLGNAYGRLGKFQEAIEYHSQHLSIAKEVGDRAGEGIAYCNLGTTYHSLAKFEEAIEYHKQGLSIAKEVGDRVREGRVCRNLGDAYYRLRKFQEAIEYHNQSLSIAKEVGDRDGKGIAYGNLGKAYHRLGKFQEAKEYHNQKLSIAKEMGDRAGEGIAFGNLGTAYHSLGKFQEAIEYYNQHLSIAKEVGDRAGEGIAYGNLGNAYHRLGKFQEAKEYHNQKLSIAKEVCDRAGEGIAYGNLGNAYQSLGKFQEAIEYFNQHLSIAKEVGNRAGEGLAHGNLGSSYRHLGKFQEAIEYSNQQLSIAKEEGNRAAEGIAYGNLGTAYHGLGKFQEAIEYLNQHLSIAKEVCDRAGEGIAYGNLGNAYQSLGKFQEAKEYHNQHLSIAKEVGDRDGEGIAYGNLGSAYDKLRKFQGAIESHNQHLSIAKEVGNRAGEGIAYGNLGNAYHSLGKFQETIVYFEQSLSIAKEVGNRAGEGMVYVNLGIDSCYLGEFQEAIVYFNQSLSIAKEVGNRDGEGMAYGILGITYHCLGKFQEAEKCFQSSIRVLDIVRSGLKTEDAWKISFRDLYRGFYTGLWNTLLELDLTYEALCAAEQGRAQALVDSLKIQYDLTALSPGSIEPKEVIYFISNELSTPTVFVGLTNKTINFWVINKEYNFELRRSKIHGRTAKENSITVLLETTLKKIGAGVAARCENRTLDEPVYDSSSNTGDDEEPAQTLQCTIESLQPLHDAIIGPITDLCQGDELIIVPDGPLCLAPFSALSESIRIRTVPSLTSLKLITDFPEDYHSKSGALLVGDPFLKQVTDEWRNPKFRELKYARQEVEMIGDILNIPPLTSTEATKNKVLERITSVALVHIAAHGRAETGEIALAPNAGWESDPRILKSRLKVKIPKEEYYILKMSDVQAVRLRARIVVLSCCHSGRGEVKSEGVVGIARAFLAAGARSVLVSLWAISDEATMEFMKSFYQCLTGGASASVALHQAMKTLRNSEKFCAAKYWAPFVLIGDDVSLEF